MRIGIDIMGGDFAPETSTMGAILALDHLADDDTLVMIGDEREINKRLERENVKSSKFEIIHTTEVIGMAEHPAKTFAQKANSSIVVGFEMLKQGKIEAFTSAGNTGAMLVGIVYSIKSIPGIIRPCAAVSIPGMHGGHTVFLDVGINPDCRPDVLYQWAMLGSVYAESVYGIKNPRVGLLNIGEEEEKGNLLTKAAHELMKGSTQFNFIGNVQGNDLYNDLADVIVCDGFTGNVVLKQAESFYAIAKSRGISDEYLDKFNFENYGGTPILGINSTVTIGHGISNANAIKNMIIHTKEVAEAKLAEKIKEAFK